MAAKKKPEVASSVSSETKSESRDCGPDPSEVVAWMMRRMARPFPLNQVKFRPGGTSGQRAMALAYIDARLVMDRLDEVVGPSSWSNEFLVLPDGSVQATIIVSWPDGQVTHRSDRGVPSNKEGPKGAASDAFKRAAVGYGIGRYLYRLGASWVRYDPQKKVLLEVPTLPAWALPGPDEEMPGTYMDEDEEPASAVEHRPEGPHNSRAEYLDELIRRARLPASTVASWLTKANVRAIDELPHEAMEACICYVEGKLKQVVGRDDPEAAARASRG